MPPVGRPDDEASHVDAEGIRHRESTLGLDDLQVAALGPGAEESDDRGHAGRQPVAEEPRTVALVDAPQQIAIPGVVTRGEGGEIAPVAQAAGRRETGVVAEVGHRRRALGALVEDGDGAGADEDLEPLAHEGVARDRDEGEQRAGRDGEDGPDPTLHPREHEEVDRPDEDGEEQDEDRDARGGNPREAGQFRGRLGDHVARGEILRLIRARIQSFDRVEALVLAARAAKDLEDLARRDLGVGARRDDAAEAHLRRRRLLPVTRGPDESGEDGVERRRLIESGAGEDDRPPGLEPAAERRARVRVHLRESALVEGDDVVAEVALPEPVGAGRGEFVDLVALQELDFGRPARVFPPEVKRRGRTRRGGTAAATDRPGHVDLPGVQAA
ncbi:MAG: hypothetical protein R3F20_13150 [Planctomycetota bacterium]